MSSLSPTTYVPPQSPYQKVSCDDIDFSVACTVMESWDLVTAIPNWERVTGEIFLRRLFETSPQLQQIWGFGTGPITESIAKSDKFIHKGATLLSAVDKAVAFLGPNLQPLEEELFALGRRHIHMGAEPEFWPLVGDALFHTLRMGLGKGQYTEFVESSWKIIYDFMSYWMIEGLLAEKKDRWQAAQVVQAAQRRRSSNYEAPPAMQDISRRSSCSSYSTTSSSVYSEQELEDGGDVNIYERVPAEAIDYRTVQLVLDSWDAVTSVPNWQSVAGTIVLRELFELAPEIKTAWGFPVDFDPDNLEDHANHNRFLNKGLGFMNGVNKAVQFMGPDLEPLEMELQDLGRIHYLHMAALPQYWPPMGVALLHTLEEVLGQQKMTREVERAWRTVYSFMAYWMIEGLLAEKRGE
ncbi:bacterial hemoglobin [Seminavis robusta]|uniref:Bacterial hemoglobin n=1 Tax=Seminavis robusta TaxID=568900 RepID=A0A9N8DJC1_9STRA|nr:bacterial hemoglobin [Seminavis robusta]|eukprot:Sro153_g069790.1 bacterial hemoglobin (409) ;mRNA; r:72872-74196